MARYSASTDAIPTLPWAYPFPAPPSPQPVADTAYCVYQAPVSVVLVSGWMAAAAPGCTLRTGSALLAPASCAMFRELGESLLSLQRAMQAPPLLEEAALLQRLLCAMSSCLLLKDA